MRGGSNKLLPAAEVAALLGVHRSTVYRRWREWGLPARADGRGRLRFRVRDVALWLERRAA